MSTQTLLCTSLATLLLGAACSESTTFKGSPKSAVLNNSKDLIPVVAPMPLPVPAALQVVLPNHEIRSGLKTLQANAIVTGAKSNAVTWKVEGPTGLDVGTIDAKGLYTSPDKLAAEIEITITATLLEDSTVTGNDAAKVVPAEQIFVGCNEGTLIFPIIAEVYRLPVDTAKLPKFEDIESDKTTTVCMDQFNVPVRNFNDGFPGVTDLNEWFALHTTGKIIAPTAGTYTFRLTSDDGSIFYIDGTSVVNNDQKHSPKSVDGSTPLTAGPHAFVLDYFQGPADQIALELYWKVPGSTQFVIVPPSAFSK